MVCVRVIRAEVRPLLGFAHGRLVLFLLPALLLLAAAAAPGAAARAAAGARGHERGGPRRQRRRGGLGVARPFEREVLVDVHDEL